MFGGSVTLLSIFTENFSGAIENSKQHIEVTTDMHLLSGLFSTTIKYFLCSYFMEKSSICDNAVTVLLYENTAENLPETVDKVVQILDTILNLMYKKAI